MQIRSAKIEDTREIVELGSRSLCEGPYKDEVDNPEQSAQTCLSVIKSDNGKVIVAEDEGVLVGLLGFMIYPHYFTGQKTAIELMWYVVPEHRRSMTGVCLVRAAMREAKALGAVKMQMTAPTLEVAKAYEALGFKALEMSYQKVL